MELTDAHLERMFDEDSEAVLRYFARRVFDFQVATDLTSETFAAALASRKKFRGNAYGDVRPWLFGIAKNQLREYYRKGRVEQDAMRRLAMEPVEVGPDDAIELEKLTELAELRSRLARHLDRLPDDQRIAIDLRILRGFEYSRISDDLGVTEATLRARVSRGLKSLRRMLEIEDEEQHSE